MEKYSVLTSEYFRDKTENVKISVDSMLNQTVMPDQYVLKRDSKIL